MKSTITKAHNKNIRKYPFLGISKIHKFVVLFYEECTGMVVTENDCYSVGMYFKNGWDMSMFEPFNGEITLSNY